MKLNPPIPVVRRGIARGRHWPVMYLDTWGDIAPDSTFACVVIVASERIPTNPATRHFGRVTWVRPKP